MKILFLDIDDVICTLRSQFAYGERLLMEAWSIDSCQMIRRLCAANEYQIVCSSVWRRNERTRNYFAVYGLIEYLHEDWKTPFLKNEEKETGKTRGQEIQNWLNNHKEVIDYIILDDDADMLDSQLSHFIRTDSYEGFGARDFLKADTLMGGMFHEYALRRKGKDRKLFNFDEIVG